LAQELTLDQQDQTLDQVPDQVLIKLVSLNEMIKEKNYLKYSLNKIYQAE
jgi:hypothetical protein